MSADAAAPADPQLDAALKSVLRVVFREHPLTANQLLTLAAELQKVGVHRLVEEHLERSRRRTESPPPD